MNNELQKALLDIINSINSGTVSAIGFLKGEIPDVIQQILLWNGVKSAILFVVGILFSIFVVIANIKAYKYLKAEEELNYPDELLLFFTIATLINIILLIISLAFLLNITWLQILIAPKVWLIEYSTSLIK
jgi:hypothetical protein